MKLAQQMQEFENMAEGDFIKQDYRRVSNFFLPSPRFSNLTFSWMALLKLSPPFFVPIVILSLTGFVFCFLFVP